MNSSLHSATSLSLPLSCVQNKSSGVSGVCVINSLLGVETWTGRVRGKDTP